MKNNRKSRFEREKNKTHSSRRGGWRAAALYAIFFFFMLAIFLMIIFDQPKEEWPDVLKYLSTNPLLAAVLVSLVAFLAVDRFRELSDRVGSLNQQFFDQINSVDRELEGAVEKVESKLTAKWERIGNRLDQIEQENPWLISLAENELLVNIPTAIAAIKNIETFILSEEFGVAYEVLYNAAKEDSEKDKNISGTAYDFEALAVISFVIFEDAATADLLLWKAQKASGGRFKYWLALRVQFALHTGRLARAFELSAELYSAITPSLWDEVLALIGRPQGSMYSQDKPEELLSVYPFIDDLVATRKTRRGRAWFDRQLVKHNPDQNRAELLKARWVENRVGPENILVLENVASTPPSSFLYNIAIRRSLDASDECSLEIAALAKKPGLQILKNFSELSAAKQDAAEAVGNDETGSDSSTADVQAGLDELFPFKRRARKSRSPRISPEMLMGVEKSPPASEDGSSDEDTSGKTNYPASSPPDSKLQLDEQGSDEGTNKPSGNMD